MIEHLVLLSTAALFLVASTTSVVVATVLYVSRNSFRRLTPTAVKRAYLAAAAAPLIVAIVTVGAVLAPYFGWIGDACCLHGDDLASAHLCTEHLGFGATTIVLITMVGLLGLRLLLRLATTTISVMQARGAVTRLKAVSRQHDDFYVFPVAGPQAFVVGTWRPLVFISDDLLNGAFSEFLAPVLHHERSHVEKRDPLVRLVTRLFTTFHLPFIDTFVESLVHRAQEMTADLHAASRIGSRLLVADALVKMTRYGPKHFRFGLAFADNDVDDRVHNLLDTRLKSNQPTVGSLLALMFVLTILVVGTAQSVHHVVESAVNVVFGL